MTHSLTKISQQLIDQELTLDRLRSPNSTDIARAFAAVAICAFYGKREFPFKTGALSYKQYMSKLFPHNAEKAMRMTLEHGLHEYTPKGYRRIVITPPADFMTYVAKFQGNVPAGISEIVGKCKLRLEASPQDTDSDEPPEPIADLITLANSLLDETPGRDAIIASRDRRLQACVLHIVTHHCRSAFIDEACHARFSFASMIRGLFGRTYAAYSGSCLRAASSTLGFHSKTGGRLMLHPNAAFIAAIEQHPLTALLVNNFVESAADDLRKVGMDPEAILRHGTSVAQRLAEIIIKHSDQQVIEALTMVRAKRK